MEPFDKIMAFVNEQVAAQLRYTYDSPYGGDTPIERIFLTSLMALSITGEWVPIHHLSKRKEDSDTGKCVIYVSRQVQIGKYRADFLAQFWLGTNGWRNLVIECDGHDFHERTKEQAAKDRARDREISLLGYTVFRFTGSELYRDPIKCAKQVLDWAYQVDKAASEQ